MYNPHLPRLPCSQKRNCDDSMMHDAFSKLLKQAPFFSPGTLGICNLIQPQSIRDPLQLSILRIPRGPAVGIYIDVIRKFLEHFNLFLKALAIPATRKFCKYSSTTWPKSHQKSLCWNWLLYVLKSETISKILDTVMHFKARGRQIKSTIWFLWIFKSWNL